MSPYAPDTAQTKGASFKGRSLKRILYIFLTSPGPLFK